MAVQWRFVHNAPETEGDQRYAYHWRVLRAALEITRGKYGDYRLEPGLPMSEKLQVVEMQRPQVGLNTLVLDATQIEDSAQEPQETAQAAPAPVSAPVAAVPAPVAEEKKAPNHREVNNFLAGARTRYGPPMKAQSLDVLVVGAGASGSQIAEELQKAGKTVYLSVGEHYRPPRAYRGRDYCWWLGALGLWDEVKIQPKKKHVAFAVSGYEGGKTVDFRRLAHQGINLVGVT